MNNPAAISMDAPVRVKISGKASNTKSPNTIADSNCIYWNGASTLAWAKLKADIIKICPMVASDTKDSKIILS